MAKLFADRIFIAINGFEVLHAKSGSISRSQGVARVETMTRNRRTAGYKKANMGVKLELEIDIEAKRAQIDPALAADEAELTAVAECGGERYIITGLIESEMSLRGSVGDGSKTFSFEGLDITNENGTSVNVDISL